MVLLQGTAPYSIGYQPIASLYCSRRFNINSLFILVSEGFCSGFCPFLNGVRHGARCFRPLACVDMMHSVIALCSLARLAQMHTPNTLTGNGCTSCPGKVCYCQDYEMEHQVRLALTNGGFADQRLDDFSF